MPATTRNTQKAKAGIRARQDAVRQLIIENQARFDQMVEENRVRLGLPRKATSETPEELRAKLERARKRAEKYEDMLRRAEADRQLATR